MGRGVARHDVFGLEVSFGLKYRGKLNKNEDLIIFCLFLLQNEIAKFVYLQSEAEKVIFQGDGNTNE